jgi:hypothetical protein
MFKKMNISQRFFYPQFYSAEGYGHPYKFGSSGIIANGWKRVLLKATRKSRLERVFGISIAIYGLFIFDEAVMLGCKRDRLANERPGGVKIA